MRPIDDTALEVINVSRRAFLGTMSAVGLMLAVGCSPRPATTDQPKYGADSMPHGWVDNPLVFVAIAPDGTVTIVCHRSEMVGFQWILDHLAPDRFHLSGASAARCRMTKPLVHGKQRAKPSAAMTPPSATRRSYRADETAT